MTSEFQSKALGGFSLWPFQAALAATATFSRSAKPTHFSGWSLSSAIRKVARGVTDVGVGSGALFGKAGTWITGAKKSEIRAEDSKTARSKSTDE